MAAPDGDAATASTSAVTSPPMIAADVSGGKQPTYLELITSKTSATTPGATPPGKADAPAEASKETPGKTKRERADDNWKLLVRFLGTGTFPRASVFCNRHTPGP